MDSKKTMYCINWSMHNIVLFICLQLLLTFSEIFPIASENVIKARLVPAYRIVLIVTGVPGFHERSTFYSVTFFVNHTVPICM